VGAPRAKQHPPNGYAAKFSIPYAIAVGMLRATRLVDYEEAVVHDSAVRALAGKVRYVVDPDILIRASSPATCASR